MKLDKLRWRDPPLERIRLPGGVLKLTLGIGSGLSHRPGDPADRLWAIGDRGPNLKIPQAVGRYGLKHLERLEGLDGAKVLPLPELAPTLAELRIDGGRVELVRTVPLHDGRGRPFSGRPLPGGEGADMEPVFDLAGHPIVPDPAGADTEAVAALPDGGFWVAEEYGPSLMKVAADGEVLVRWLPEGASLSGATYPVAAVLPPLAAERRLNRGFEALAASPDGGALYACLQSAVDPAGRHTLIWTLDAATGALIAEHRYRFDAPASFARDAAQGRVRRRDLKVCELACLAPGVLLALERISHTAKIYRVDLAGDRLRKTLLFSTDDHHSVSPGLEGMALTSGRELVLATDNDFGIEGDETRFYRLAFRRDILLI